MSIRIRPDVRRTFADEDGRLLPHHLFVVPERWAREL
jgi:hypothetical protein